MKTPKVKLSVACMVAVTLNLSGLVRAQNVTIDRGTALDLDASTMSVNGDFTNNGTFNAGSGDVILDGKSENQSLIGTFTFYNLTVTKGPDTVEISSPAFVNGVSSIFSGTVNLNGTTLFIQPTGLLKETPGNIVTGGRITTTRVLNAPQMDNVGGLGAEITSMTNLGNTTVTRVGSALTSHGISSVKRYYDIVPVNNKSLNATLVFHYDNTELNGQDPTSLKLYRATIGDTIWTSMGGTVDTSTRTVILTGIDSLSRWTLSSGSFATDVKPPESSLTVLKSYELYQNYPNPFNPTTNIGFNVPNAGFVSLKVYDMLGREVATLVNEKENAGSHSVTFDGSKLASGVYFYRLATGSYSATKKFVLMK